MLTVRSYHSHTKSTNADLHICGVSPSSSTTATATPTTANVVAFAPPAPKNPRNRLANDASANSTPSHLYAPSRNGGPEPRSPLSRRMMNAISLHGVPHPFTTPKVKGREVLTGQCDMSRFRPAKPRNPRPEMPTCVPSRVFG